MSDQRDPSFEFVRDFAALFEGRHDAHGEGLGRRVDEEVTPQVYKEHLIGKRRIGIYCVAGPSRDRVKFGAIDIDIPDWELACLLGERLKHYGVATQIERSKGKGWHVWFFFTAWVEAWKVRAVASMAIHDIGDRVPGPLEVFPKQDAVPDGGYGNYINLPLFALDAKDGRTCFCVPDADGKPSLVTEWNPSAVERTKESSLDEVIELAGLTKRPVAQPRAYEQGINETPAHKQYDALLPCAVRMYQDGAGEGSRNEWAFRLAIHFKRTGYPKGDAIGVMLRWNERNRPPMPRAELEGAVSSAFDPKHKNESLGCDNPLILPVCALSECPVYRKIHPGQNENAATKALAGVDDSDPNKVRLTGFNPGTLAFEFVRGDLIYRITGLDNRKGSTSAIVVIERNGTTLHRGMVNLENEQKRRAVEKIIFDVTDKGVTDVARDLMNISDGIARRLEEKAKTGRDADQKARQGYVLSEKEEQDAIRWGREDHRILYRMIEFTSRCGLVREKRNRCVLLLLGTSRKMQRPISGIGKGDSSSGKSHLASEIFKLLPEEDFIELTRMTGAALEYRGEYSLQHKLLFIREAPGSEQAEHSLRTFISEGDLILATVEKNEAGKMEGKEIRIRGPLAFYTTTTMIEVNPENETRFFTVPADESESMTAACLVPAAYVAQFGPINAGKDELKKWRNFQRVLVAGQEVIVPYAERLTKGFPTQALRGRRDFSRMIELIKASAFLHQHHREWQVIYDAAANPKRVLVASVADYAIVKSIIEGSLMRSTFNIKAGQQELLAQLESLTEVASANKARGETLDPEFDVTNGDDGDEVWVSIPYLRKMLGKTQRSVMQLVRALDEEGLIEAKLTRRPPRVRVGRSAMEGGEFFLPTIDPNKLFEEYPDDKAHAYDPLEAPDFEDIYGSPTHGWKHPTQQASKSEEQK